MSARILYYGAGWPTNIGNAFIDLGCMQALRAALGSGEVAFASEMPRWFFSEGAARLTGTGRKPLLRRGGVRKRGAAALVDNALDIAAVARCDMVVLAGMAMCAGFVRVNGPTLRTIARRGTPIFLLGTGALRYTEEEKEVYGKFLGQINPVCFISRDDRSYEMFGPMVREAHRGIDCGFFVADAYAPPALEMPPYVVANFDAGREADFDPQGRLVVRAHHNCWGPVDSVQLKHGGTLISDIPHDYLALYAGAQEVHSDRVHACVAALAYGNPARLYHGTPRGSLFGPVGAEEIREKTVRPDMDLLRKKKDDQVRLARQVVASVAR